MTVAQLSIVSTPINQIDTEVLVLGVLQHASKAELVVSDQSAQGFADELRTHLGDLEAFGVTGKRDQLVRIPAPSSWKARSIALLGLGNTAPDRVALRELGGTLGRVLRGLETVSVALPTADADDTQALAEGILIGAYAYNDYRTSHAQHSLPARAFRIVDDSDSPDLVRKAIVVATAVHRVRDLVNTPPSDLPPAVFADTAHELAERHNLSVRTWDESELAAEGFGGLVGVGKGSSRPPRLVHLEYTPAEYSSHVALVGKGITFDTGGLSLKPAASMVGMKEDMTGAATALAVIVAAAELGINTRVSAWLALAENMPSGTAMRPEDVITIRGGTTVEVLNTDAEGRLVLADALRAASETHPDLIVDVATLTGAAIVALGTKITPLMGNNDDAISEIRQVASDRGEEFWPMPQGGALRALLNSEIADIANVKMGNRSAGSSVAATFLAEFIGTTSDGTGTIPWVHLDIAGTGSNSEGGYGINPKGPTGVAVRTLIELISRREIRQ